MVAEKLVSRVLCTRGGDELLKVHLKRVTELGSKEIPQELLVPVIDASHDAECRQEIMRHLRECLSEPTGKYWRRIYGGLALTEKLVEQGSPTLLVETAHGYHFDLVQKVSFLEHFDATARGCSDRSAETMVRQKASEVRKTLVPQLQNARAEEFTSDWTVSYQDFCKDTMSVGGLSTSTGSTTASTSGRSGSSSTKSDSTRSSQSRKKASWFSVTKLRHSGGKAKQKEADPKAIDALAARAKLAAQLQRITDSGMIDIPAELFAPIAEASYEPDGCQVILCHLRGCLQTGKWRRIHGGLCGVEYLLRHGSPSIAAELLQLTGAVWALGEFEYCKDWRAQSLVRKKALALHDDLVERQTRNLDEALDMTYPDDVKWDPTLFHVAREMAHHHIDDWMEEKTPVAAEFEDLHLWADRKELGCWSPRSVGSSSSRPSSGPSSSDFSRESDEADSPCGFQSPSAHAQNFLSTGRDRAVSSFGSEDCKAMGPFFTPLPLPALPAPGMPVPSCLEAAFRATEMKMEGIIAMTRPKARISL